MYHCDLSYCCLDSASCALLGEGLRDNHSLYGLHVVGVSPAFIGSCFKMLHVGLPQLVCSLPSEMFQTRVRGARRMPMYGMLCGGFRAATPLSLKLAFRMFYFTVNIRKP